MRNQMSASRHSAILRVLDVLPGPTGPIVDVEKASCDLGQRLLWAPKLRELRLGPLSLDDERMASEQRVKLPEFGHGITTACSFVRAAPSHSADGHACHRRRVRG